MKTMLLAGSLLLLASVSGLAQEVSQAEVFAGYSYLRTESSFVRHLHGGDGSVARM
ncbi:MAG: hypothetical protein HOP19_24030 [Acidobacteria bacterium]|nr:hypothetical protein [Acidobacteriota bacterium]